MSHPLVEKYGDARLPRYTSYPTTPVFDTEIGEGRYGQWLRRMRRPLFISMFPSVGRCAGIAAVTPRSAAVIRRF